MSETKELFDNLITISLGIPTIVGVIINNEKLLYPMLLLWCIYSLIVKKLLGWNEYNNANKYKR